MCQQIHDYEKNDFDKITLREDDHIFTLNAQYVQKWNYFPK